MDTLAVLLIVLILISFASFKYRVPPFLTLIGGAFLFGILTGLNPDTIINQIIRGMSKTFMAFGILIFCGSVIAKSMQKQNHIEEIVSDINKKIRDFASISAISSYLLTIPLTCCITAYIMLAPIISGLEKNKNIKNIGLYLAAVSGVVAYVLVFPTPVTIPLYEALSKEQNPLIFDAISIPLSITILVIFVFLGRHYIKKKRSEAEHALRDKMGSQIVHSLENENISFHKRAWAPFIVMIFAIPLGYFLLGLSHTGIINFIMLSGLVTAFLLANPKIRNVCVNDGAKHAGLIIFDLCGAGALGFVMVESGIANDAINIYPDFMPVILIPFLIAAILATAQGSRVVTGVISAEILSGLGIFSTIHPFVMILLVSAGACTISYVTDPFFWLVQRTTNDSPGKVVKYYTLPLAAAGIFILIIAVLLDFFVLNEFH
ncbi:GntP family permease [Methanochimaera problematica]|uniref:GntP family permease n=1 Tax=Methanochimaera problematica TaxID=2609417 RepID=UPI00293916C8|nr:GntP family permease [Methanoplanus sp. FWC-SCC4]